MKQNKTEILDLKNIMTKMKNSIGSFNSIKESVKKVEEKKSEFE